MEDTRVKYILLSKTFVRINKKGKPTGKKIKFYEGGKLAVGPGKSLAVTYKVLAVLESLLSSGCHFVLQSSEGDGIKVIGKDGMSRCIILIRSGCMQTFNLKADSVKAKELMKELNLIPSDVNVRNNSKSKYVYTDFSETCKPEKISKFILKLPPSSKCVCGSKKDIDKANE
jgi:hypothetical protein